MERDLGTRLEWAAVDHHNTDNPHVHILIRGLTESGNALSIDRSYIKSGIRDRSQEIASRKLGLRVERDILESRALTITRDQFTEIDRALIGRSDTRNVTLATILKESLPGDGLRWWRHRAPAVGVVVEAPGGGSGQKRAPGSRVWEGAAGTWPEPSPHTASDCGRFAPSGYPWRRGRPNSARARPQYPGRCRFRGSAMVARQTADITT
jgi:hypothetical protein